METRHAHALMLQWDDFQRLCDTIRRRLSEADIPFDLVFEDLRGGDLRATEAAAGGEVVSHLVSVREFLCPLCRAEVGVTCFISYLGQCPHCRYPNLFLM
jgi:hypothetical protein